MELLSSSTHLICSSTAHKSFSFTFTSQANPPLHITKIRTRRFHLYSKRSDYQDFQEYAKPSRLLSATAATVGSDLSLKKLAKSFSLGSSECLYKVELQTSGLYGSGLTDFNSGILLCLIDESGDSILQRISASSSKEQLTQTENNVDSEVLHFKRGSVDVFTFEGPKLQKIKALWISLESGQWRLGGASLSIINLSQPPVVENGETEAVFVGFRYDFVTEDILLGEGGENSMIQLKPCLVTSISGDNFTLLRENQSRSSSTETDVTISNEESMREYADLKNSLLLYDTLIILAGSAIVSFSSGESLAFAFLIGGVGGFLYLLLLQRSVDELLTSESNNRTGSFAQAFGSLKGPVSNLALALTFTAIAVKFGSGNGTTMVVSPKEVVFGMMGFLACKVAVLLAAFKPMELNLEENE